MKRTVTASFSLDPAIIAAIEEIAKERHVSRSKVLSLLVEHALKDRFLTLIGVNYGNQGKDSNRI